MILAHDSMPAPPTLHTPLVQLGASAGQEQAAWQVPWHNCLQVPSPVPVHRWVASGQRQLVHLAPIAQMGCKTVAVAVIDHFVVTEVRRKQLARHWRLQDSPGTHH